MAYLLGGGVFLWVLLRRILFKMWWCVALAVFVATPVQAYEYSAIMLKIAYGSGMAGPYTGDASLPNNVWLHAPGGVSHFYLSVDGTVNGYMAQHAAVFSRVDQSWVRLDIWGPLMNFTTYAVVAEETFGAYAHPMRIEGGCHAGMTPTSSVLCFTSRAPDGDGEQGYDDEDPAVYWLSGWGYSTKLLEKSPFVDDADVADPSGGYFPAPEGGGGMTEEETAEAIGDAFEDAADFDPSGYGAAADSLLHEDLLPTISKPATATALKAVINTGFSDLTGSADWLYEEDTSDMDIGAGLSSLVGSGGTPAVPYLFNLAIDAAESAHTRFLPIFTALSFFLTLVFTISVVFMMFRLFLWAIDIARPVS